MDRGKANACVEFDVEDDVLQSQYNAALKVDEYFLVGDVNLISVNPEAFFNF